MIRKNSERNKEYKENLFQGTGGANITHLLNGPDEMLNKGRVFAHTTLKPGNSIGFHLHKGDSEIYYILSGTAEYNDNGTLVTLTSGDVAITPEGEGHGIKNIGDNQLNIIALILYK